MFQSTRPRGARLTGSSAGNLMECFNPRAREGRDVAVGNSVWICQVSIHAPARGATVSSRLIVCLALVSIHAPARGATAMAATSKPDYKCFNPRAREGRDPDCLLFHQFAALFQSTRPRGARQQRFVQRYSDDTFQSTRPRGARP